MEIAFMVKDVSVCVQMAKHHDVIQQEINIIDTQT